MSERTPEEQLARDVELFRRGEMWRRNDHDDRPITGEGEDDPLLAELIRHFPKRWAIIQKLGKCDL